MSKTATMAISAKQEVKEFNFYELLGLRKAFYAIEVSNPKRSGKVDYWLSKNDKIVGDAFGKYLEAEQALIIQHAEVFKSQDFLNKHKEQVEFITYKGKDENDTLLNDKGSFFKLNTTGEKPMLDFVVSPTWDLEIPAAEEGGEPTVKKMKYEIKFTSAESEKEFQDKLQDLQNDFKVPAELWTLKEENLEGLNVMWKGREEDLTQFRNLLYDNAVSA